MSATDGRRFQAVRLLGPTVVPVMDTDSAGELTVQVTPGAWEVLASTPTSGIAGVDAEVDAETEPDPVVVKLGDARVSVGDLAVALSETVQFETGSSRLLPLSWGLLDEVARTLRATPQLVQLAVEGHTDSTGSDEVNRVLSLERAEAVRAYLIARGVAPSRLRRGLRVQCAGCIQRHRGRRQPPRPSASWTSPWQRRSRPPTRSRGRARAGPQRQRKPALVTEVFPLTAPWVPSAFSSTGTPPGPLRSSKSTPSLGLQDVGAAPTGARPRLQ